MNLEEVDDLIRHTNSKMDYFGNSVNDMDILSKLSIENEAK